MRRDQAKLRGISQDWGERGLSGQTGQREYSISDPPPPSCKRAEAGLGKNPPLTSVHRKGESEGREREQSWKMERNKRQRGNNVSEDESRDVGKGRIGPETALLRTRNPPAPQVWRGLGFTRAGSQMDLEGRGLLDSVHWSLQHRERLSQTYPFHLRCLPLPSPLVPISNCNRTVPCFPFCLYEFFLPFMFSLFRCFGQYMPSASLVFMVERNPGGIGVAEEVVVRDRLRSESSETARRRRLSLFPAAAEKTPAAGVRLPTTLHKARAPPPSLPRRWHGRDCTCGLRTPGTPRCQTKPVRYPLTSLRPRQLPTKPNSKGGCSQRPEQSPWFPNWARAPNLEAKKATECQAQGRCRVPHFPRPKAA